MNQAKTRGRPMLVNKTSENGSTVYVSTTLFRSNMHEYLRKCSSAKKNIMLRSHGKDEAAVISVEDLDMLNGIKIGLEQISEGKSMPHNEAMRLIKEKLGLK